MKANELREKTVDELKKELLALLREQFNLRMQKGMGQGAKTNLPLRTVRLDIARIKTILNEKGTRV